MKKKQNRESVYYAYVTSDPNYYGKDQMQRMEKRDNGNFILGLVCKGFFKWEEIVKEDENYILVLRDLPFSCSAYLYRKIAEKDIKDEIRRGGSPIWAIKEVQEIAKSLNC